MPATEVLSMPLKPGADPQKVLELANNLSVVGKIFTGLINGRSNQLLVFIDWDSIEAHRDFNASSSFPPFLEEFKKIVAGDFTLTHVDFKPSLQSLHRAQTAPVTEVVTFYFAVSPPEGFLETVLRFRDEVVAHQPGYIDAAFGVTYEEVVFNGEKGQSLVALVGWDSEQSWRTFADSEEYKEKNPGGSLDVGVLRGFEMEVVGLAEYRD